MSDEETSGAGSGAWRIDLRPPGVIRFGLSRAIQVHSEEVRVKYPQVNLSLDLVEDEHLLAEEAVRVLYGVYLESLYNALRHAQASRVAVRYHPAGAEMALEIEDDGCGFKLPADWLEFTRRGHFGLARLRQQVAAEGGHFSITSAPGQGTKVCARVPIQAGEG